MYPSAADGSPLLLILLGSSLVTSAEGISRQQALEKPNSLLLFPDGLDYESLTPATPMAS